MKKILFFILINLTVSCVSKQNNTDRPHPKYKVGDIVYMKPDSTKALVYFYGGNDWNPCYALRYTDKNGMVRETGSGWANRLITESELY